MLEQDLVFSLEQHGVTGKYSTSDLTFVLFFCQNKFLNLLGVETQILAFYHVHKYLRGDNCHQDK